MNITNKKPLPGLLIVICVCAGSLLAWHLLPATTKADVYRAFPYGGSYATYERLANFLKPGMTIEEVRGILGKPNRRQTLNDGERWTFADDGPTAGWICIVDFSAKNRRRQLCYFFNVEHVAFANSLHHQFGNPLDSGKFDGDLMLKLRRDQWYPKKSGQ